MKTAWTKAGLPGNQLERYALRILDGAQTLAALTALLDAETAKGLISEVRFSMGRQADDTNTTKLARAIIAFIEEETKP